MTEQTLAELTFEYKDISIPVEVAETSKGNAFVAVDYKAWNSATKDMTEEQYGDIFMSLHKWFKENEIFVDEYHKDNLRNQNAPIYWLLDDNDDE